MKIGLVFGKFMPLHKGHLSLIDFSLKHCDRLFVILCYTRNESIEFSLRKQWIEKALEEHKNASLLCFEYDEKVLPNTSISSKEVSKKWAAAFKKLVPEVEIVFTSELYGQYVAEYMHIQHMSCDEKRITVPISASQIRENPLICWEYLPSYVRYFYVKKICIIGTESTGKSILTKRLAAKFNTVYVPEMARDIVQETESCTYEDLMRIAELHAKTINEKLLTANKILFVDTDLLITKSYSQFLFNKELSVEKWIEDANKFDLYLFLESDCPHIQDGTRLSLESREALNDHHKKYFKENNIRAELIRGNWDNRFYKACEIVSSAFAV